MEVESSSLSSPSARRYVLLPPSLPSLPFSSFVLDSPFFWSLVIVLRTDVDVFGGASSRSSTRRRRKRRTDDERTDREISFRLDWEMEIEPASLGFRAWFFKIFGDGMLRCCSQSVERSEGWVGEGRRKEMGHRRGA